MESYTSSILLCLVLLISTQVILNLKRWVCVKRKLPPGPTSGIPIVGNVIALGEKPHESIAKMAKTHGPLVTVQLGFITTVVATSVEMAREFLQKNDQVFLGRPLPHAITAQEHYQEAMAWLSGGPKWRSLRKLCYSHVFTTQRLEALQDLRHQMVKRMVARLSSVASEAREEINIGSLVFGTSFNLLSNNMFSVDIVDPKSNFIKELKGLVSRIMELAVKPNLSDFFPFLKPFDPQCIKRDTRVSYVRLHSMLDKIIDQRLILRASGLPRCGDFLDILVDNSQLDQHGSGELSRPDIKTLLTDLFIGGTDTTTTTVEGAMTELIKNPKVMHKLKQELLETIGLGQSMQEKDIPRLPYLQAVLKETLRLHPATPLLLPHQAQMDVEVCGYTIPKDTQVYVNPETPRTGQIDQQSLYQRAGSDTTALTFQWAMAELLQNPEILFRAQEELEKTIGKGNPVEESDIARLPYLQALVKETFRMHPSIPLLLPRKAEADIEIGGFVVPKGAQVFVNAWAIGRDASTWEDPDSFRPERFLGSEVDFKGRNFELIPFGGGRRICPGLPLAIRMLHLMLGSVIHSFGWKLEDGIKPGDLNMEDKLGISLEMVQPLRAVPIPF